MVWFQSLIKYLLSSNLCKAGKSLPTWPSTALEVTALSRPGWPLYFIWLSFSTKKALIYYQEASQQTLHCTWPTAMSLGFSEPLEDAPQPQALLYLPLHLALSASETAGPPPMSGDWPCTWISISRLPNIDPCPHSLGRMAPPSCQKSMSNHLLRYILGLGTYEVSAHHLSPPSLLILRPIDR